MNLIECTNCGKETSIYEAVCKKCKNWRHKSNRIRFPPPIGGF